jgi:adenosylmethionine-8-amino-7-oxononanoate aminotransferase
MTKPHPFAVHRSWDHDYRIVDRTDGIYIYDRSGKRYIDGSGGSSVVTSIGHGVHEIPDAMHSQAQRFSFYPAHAFSNQPFQELAERLVSLAPGEMRGQSKVWVTCTGTDATDDAVRLARQHWVEKGESSKYLVITRWQGFHGNNVAVAGYSGVTARRAIFRPMFVESPHIPPAFCYRCYFEQAYPNCDLLCARALETAIQQTGPENIAAFIAEPVVGAALGAVPAPDGYFQVIREICDKYGVLLIIDEVMTGFGRTGEMWGIEHWDGVTPDIIACAKGITSGYTPLSAVIAKNEVWEPLIEHNTPFKAGHTLNANAVSCAGAIAVLDYLFENNLVEKSAEMGTYLLARLTETILGQPLVGDVRGKGMMVGFELVEDQASKKPFDPACQVARQFEEAAYDRGLIVYPCSGSVSGQAGDMILLAPPLIIRRKQVEEIVQILLKSLQALEGSLQ